MSYTTQSRKFSMRTGKGDEMKSEEIERSSKDTYVSLSCLHSISYNGCSWETIRPIWDQGKEALISEFWSKDKVYLKAANKSPNNLTQFEVGETFPRKGKPNSAYFSTFPMSISSFNVS